MTATASTFFRPPHAVAMWADAKSIYVEMPTQSGPPYIIAYPRTQSGLAQALNVLVVAHERAEPKIISGGVKVPKSMHSHHPAVRRPKPTFTTDQRAAAVSVLRKLLRSA